MSSLSFIQYAHCCSRFIIEPTFLHYFPLPFVSFSYHPLAFDLVTYVESHACTTIYHTLSHLLCFIHQTQRHLARSSFILPKPIYFITHTIDPMPASFNPCEESELSVVKKLPRHFGILILDYELMDCQLPIPSSYPCLSFIPPFKTSSYLEQQQPQHPHLLHRRGQKHYWEHDLAYSQEPWSRF